MPEVNNSEMVRYRGGSALPQTKSRRLIPTSTTDSSSNSNNGGEDWITRKRVQTKTTKNIEKRVQRQVVLEDGRIIEEGEPEVTVDTVEDVESHSDDGEEDRHIVGGWSRQFHPDRALQAPQPGEGGSTAMSAWHPGGNVLGETLKRNTHVNDVKQHSYSTTSARNLGDISSRDVKKIISEGRSTRTFIKPLADNETPVDIPTKMTHKNASRKRMVDTENIEEVQRIQDGAVKTDRFVTRESIQDDNEETPSEGSSTDSESNDGDRDSFSQRKEDRYIDYYTVPRGKSIKEGKFLRHGIHLTSYDKSNKAGELEEDSVRRPALPYKGDSDSTGDMWAGGGGGGMPNQKKPPISDRPPSRSRSNGGTLHKSHRYSSTERESTSPGRSSSQFPVHYSKPIPRGGGSGDHQQKYHTIERGSRGPSVDSNRFYHTTNTGFGGGSDRRQLSGGGGNKRQQQVAAWQRHSMAAAGHDSDSSYSRSRSESRGQTTTQPLSMAPKRSNLKKTNHHSSMGALKTGESSVDGPATSSSGTTNLMRQGSRRLKRAMSFTGESGRKPRSRSGSIGSEAGKSLIGSFKSLYASLTKTGGGSSGGGESKKEKENRVSAANKAWFDQGTPDGGAVHGATAAPQRPPRKARSTASSMTSGQDMYSSYNKRQNKSTNNLNADYNRPLRSHTGTMRNSSGVGGSSFDVRDKGGASRSWEVYSSNNNLNSGYSTGGGGGSPTTNHSTISKSSFQRKRQPSPLRKLSPFRRSGKGSSQGGGGSTSKAPQQQQQPPKASARHSQADDRHSSPARSDIRNGRQSSLQSDRRRTSPARSDLRSTHLVGGRSEHKRGGGGSDMDDNREPRRFEEDRQMRQRGQVRSRFFGQQDGVGGDGNFSDGGGGHGSNSVRPPPDMRRLLLNNVNLSRSKSMSKDLDQQRPSVIRAI